MLPSGVDQSKSIEVDTAAGSRPAAAVEEPLRLPLPLAW